MKLLLLCLVVSIAYVDSKGGGRGGGGRGGGGRGGGFGNIFKGWGSSGKSSGSHTYPASTGLSGHGSGGSHSYPSSNGLSGRGKFGQRYGYAPRVPSYYTAPQYVYVNQYRNSNSRFTNLLIGLTMYNMGRSHVVHNHYYHDSYYRRSSSTSSSVDHDSSSTTSTVDHDSSSLSTPTDQTNENNEATCLMRIKENEKEEVLTIPCAIVTTFAEGKRKVPDPSEKTTTECVNSSVVNSPAEQDNDISKSKTIEVDSPSKQMTCKYAIETVDPLAVTGSPLNTIGMGCTIEIWTPQEIISNDVECMTLLRYAKMPVPENKDAVIMPSRAELKEMLNRPPWWLSLFLAV